MRKASARALGLANGLPGKAERKRRSAAERRALLAHSLAVAGGAEPKAWLELLVALSMAADAPAKLREMNPYLRAEEAERILDMTGATMLTVVRTGHTMRCLAVAEQLLALVTRASREGADTIAGGRTPR